MPRWLTLPAVSTAALLAFAAYSAPQSALELNYQAPDPSMAPAPKPPASSEPAPKRENRRSPGQRREIKAVFASILSAIILAAANRAPNLIPRMKATVKKTDRRRQSDPYSTNQDPDYNIQLGYEW